MTSSRDAEFRAFVHGGERRLHRTAFALTGDRSAAEDLVQDVLVRMYVRWSRIDEPMAYARRALVHASTNRWRGRARRPEVPLGPAHDREVVDGSARADDRDVIVRALAVLPARQRAVVVLRYLEDLSEADAAAALGCSTGTIKSQTSRALTRLREVLGEPLTTGGDPR